MTVEKAYDQGYAAFENGWSREAPEIIKSKKLEDAWLHGYDDALLAQLNF